MKVILLFLLFVLSSWVCAADGEDVSSNLVEIEDAEIQLFSTVYCDYWITRGLECSFDKYQVFGETENGYEEWSMGFIVYGSFANADEEEAIVLMTTDSHGNNWSSFLFRKQENWQYISDAPTFSFEFATTGEQCTKYPHPSRQDLLLCLFNDTFVQIKDNIARYYFAELSSDMGRFGLRVLDFGSNPKETSLIAFNNHKLQNVDCSNHNTQGYMASNWRVNDVDGDNNDNIYLELIEVSCEKIVSIDDIHYNDFKILPTAHRLYWLFDGETFTPTPETKAFLETLETQQ